MKNETTAINPNAIAKIEYIPLNRSKKYIWFNQPKSIFFKRRSGIYFVDESGKPEVALGDLGSSYEEVCRNFNSNMYKISQNNDGSIIIFEKAYIKVTYIGCAKSDYFYYDNILEAESEYVNILKKLNNHYIMKNNGKD